MLIQERGEGWIGPEVLLVAQKRRIELEHAGQRRRVFAEQFAQQLPSPLGVRGLNRHLGGGRDDTAPALSSGLLGPDRTGRDNSRNYKRANKKSSSKTHRISSSPTNTRGGADG